jgi:hypothetical protein
MTLMPEDSSAAALYRNSMHQLGELISLTVRASNGEPKLALVLS